MNPPQSQNTQKLAPVETYLAVTTSTITAESGGVLGSGTADITGLDSTSIASNTKSEITIYNLGSDSIGSGTKVLTIRDPISGKHIISRTENDTTGGGGSSTFIGLSDTPSVWDSTNDPNAIVMVNQGATGLTFVDANDMTSTNYSVSDPSADLMMIWDTATGNWRSILLQDIEPTTSYGDIAVHDSPPLPLTRLARGSDTQLLMPKFSTSPGLSWQWITDLAEETSPDSTADSVLIYSDASSKHMYCSLSNLPDSTGGGGSSRTIITDSTSFTTSGSGNIYSCTNSSDETATLHGSATAGDLVTILKGSDNTATTIIVPTGADSIIKSSDVNLTLCVQSDMAEFVSDGSGQWHLTACKLKPHIGSISRNGGQTIASGSTSLVSVNTSNIDVGGIVNTGSNRIDIKRTGNYRCTGTATLQLQANTSFQLYLYVDGTAAHVAQDDAVVTNNYCDVVVTTDLALSAGSYVQLYGFHNDGTTQSWLHADALRRPKLHVEELAQ